MSGESWTRARGPRRHLIRWVALLSGMTLLVGSSLAVNAATTTKPYTAAWVTGSGTTSSLEIAAGATTVTLRLTNGANPQSLGSANITPPSGYTLTGSGVVGNVLQLRGLNLAPGASIDIPIPVTTPCLAGGPAQEWALRVKQANDFSGSPGNDFVNSGSAPSTSVTGTSVCQLRFTNQPNTTKTGTLIKSGYDSTGNAIRLEIFDPNTNLVVNTSATVTLDERPATDPEALSGNSLSAVAGVATFPNLSLSVAGRRTLRASSTAASNTPDSDPFMVADTVAACDSATCTFTQTQSLNTYTVAPKKGKIGATFVSSLNLPGLRVSCDFAPYSYPDSRQPNTLWYTYDDGTTGSTKVNQIVIDKSVVQATSDNGASKYRVCYSSPVRFTDRFGNLAPQDPWSDGTSAYFGTTWYTGLLPDCGNAKIPPAPCVIGWTGDSAGDRIGTFVTPAGDPSIR
jgi:hypothetical protein